MTRTNPSRRKETGDLTQSGKRSRNASLKLLLRELQLSVTSLPELCSGIAQYLSEASAYIVDDVKLVVSYSATASNSHSAPAGKLSNWKRRSDIPLGYPGLHGQIIFRSKPKQYNTGWLLLESEAMGIHFGTGSSGACGCDGYVNSSYSVVVWLEMWPGLQAVVQSQYERYQMDATFSKLNGKYISEFCPDLR